MTHHAEGLRVLTQDEDLIKHLSDDFRKADLNAADHAMLDYAAKLTREPWAMEEADVIRLRAVGFGDSAILDINQVTGYYAFVNRLADGLGVELEHYWNERGRVQEESDE